jgi:hypothetical protein
VALVILSACDRNHRKVPFVPVTVADNESILHVYRPQQMSNAMYSPDLLIDGETRTAVKAGNKYMFRIEPGKHAITLALNDGFSGKTSFDLTALAGSAYYLRVDTGLELQQGVAGYTPYARRFDLVAVEHNLAIEQITECCSLEAKDTGKEKPEHMTGETSRSPDEENTSQGFSTDKTANPFDH